jgi:hypothetical protein
LCDKIRKKIKDNTIIVIIIHLIIVFGDLVFNATFNNISVILLWSVLLVEETGVPRETTEHAASH